MKKKLLFAMLCIVSALGMRAEDVFKDVTATYLTNADFEGEYTVYSNPSGDRAIYKPNGWTVSYTTGDPNDITALNSSCLMWNNFSSKAQLSTGGNNTYWVRMRWGTGANLELSQTITLPAGSYKLTAAYYKNGSGGDGYIFVNSTTKNTNVNEDVWKSLSIKFTSDGIASTKLGCRSVHTNTYEKFLAYDNFVLEWNLTEALTTLIASATEVYNEDASNTNLKNAIDAANAVKDSQDATELENAYNNLKSVSALALNRKAWKNAKDTAEAAFANTVYANVTGKEKADLQAEIAKAEPTTDEGYEEAAGKLTIATTNFTSAKDSYDAYITAKAAADGVNEADVLAVVIAGNADATAADALAASVILPKAFANKAATAMNPIVTDYVINGTFDNSDISMWICNTSFQNRGRKTTDDSGAGTMNNNKPWWENWNGDALKNKMYQTVNNLPNGTYRLDITAFVNKLNTESQYVFANSDQTTLTEAGTGVAYEVYTVVTNNKVEVGLEQTTATANWMGIDNVSLRYYGAGDVINDAKNAAHKLAWLEAKAAAEAALANTDYANVTGSEKSNLETEIAKAEPTTAQGYDDAAAALTSQTSAFTTAAPAYNALIAEITYATAINVPTNTAQAALNAEATATTVVAATQNLKVLEYTTITAAFPNDLTSSLLGTWEAGNYGTTSGQGYVGSETYFDKWNGSAMDLSSSKTVTLPAGAYTVMVAGRGVSATTMNLSVKVGDADAVSVPFLMIGDTGKGIDTAGATNFSDEGTYSNNNIGRGWQYRYVPFVLTAASEVTIAINGHLNSGTWQSFYSPVLLANDATVLGISLTELAAAIQAAEDAKDEVSTLLTQAAQAADPTAADITYETVVGGSEAAELLAAATQAQNVDQTSIADVQAATTALTTATTAYNAAKPAYERALMVIGIAQKAKELSGVGEETAAIVVGALQPMFTQASTTATTIETEANNQITFLMNQAITYKNIVLGFEKDQYAPYKNAEGLTIIETAKTMGAAPANYTNEQFYTQAVAMFTYTWTKNTEDVDAIFNGMFDSTVEGDWGLTGWTRTNAWGQQRTNVDDGAGAYSTAYYNQPGSLQYGNQGVYTMPLAANTAYKLTFCYRSHENDSNNGMTVSVKSGDNGISNVKFSENDSKTNWKTAEALFTTGAAGNYVLTLANSGNTWITNVSLVKSSSAAIEMTEADGAGNLQVEKYSDINLTKTVYKGWNTVVLPFSVDAATVTTQFGAGKLYKFTDADAGQLNFEEVTTGMVAHTPYLFNSEADADAKDKELTFAGVITANGNPITQGTDYNFVGTYVPYAKNAAENPITDQDYVLGETAFKKAAGKNALKAFRCYIKANEATSTAKSLNICINGETTSIDTINGEPVNASEGIYDLSGRAVKNPTKGMYIINGKKYLVK